MTGPVAPCACGGFIVCFFPDSPGAIRTAVERHYRTARHCAYSKTLQTLMERYP
jgi:hypothetical protein